MAKNTTVFFCRECGFESAKWMGQCPGCHAWNMFTEEPVRKSAPASSVKREQRPFRKARPVLIRDIDLSESKRISSGMSELDRVPASGNPPFCSRYAAIFPNTGQKCFIFPARKACSR